MKITKYAPDTRDVVRIAEARSTGVGTALLKAIEAKRDEVRKKMESAPKVSDDIKEDFRFLLGMVYMGNWILEDLLGGAQQAHMKGESQ